MKSQDIVILFKLLCLSRISAGDLLTSPAVSELSGWNDIQDDLRHVENLNAAQRNVDYLFTLRGLSESLGISKSEVQNSLKRNADVQLIRTSRQTGKADVNKKALMAFLRHGLRLVFPVKPAEICRGIPTTFAAPVLAGKLLSAGSLIMVWPDANGKDMGQAIAPLYKSVPFAVRRDPELYAWLALADAVRLGNPREMSLALELMEEKITNDSSKI